MKEIYHLVLETLPRSRPLLPRPRPLAHRIELPHRPRSPPSRVSVHCCRPCWNKAGHRQSSCDHAADVARLSGRDRRTSHRLTPDTALSLCFIVSFLDLGSVVATYPPLIPRDNWPVEGSFGYTMTFASDSLSTCWVGLWVRFLLGIKLDFCY